MNIKTSYENYKNKKFKAIADLIESIFIIVPSLLIGILITFCNFFKEGALLATLLGLLGGMKFVSLLLSIKENIEAKTVFKKLLEEEQQKILQFKD